MKEYVPNALTLLRIAIAGVFPFVPQSWWIPLFVVAAITEFGDGYLSRRWNVVSDFGRTMDPVADKAFVFSVLLTLWLKDAVELWEIAVIAPRDLVILVGSSIVYFLGDRREFEHASARKLGKVCTNFQFAFLLAAILTGDVPLWITIPTAFVSLAAAGDYARYYWLEVRASTQAAT